MAGGSRSHVTHWKLEYLLNRGGDGGGGGVVLPSSNGVRSTFQPEVYFVFNVGRVGLYFRQFRPTNFHGIFCQELNSILVGQRPHNETANGA